MKAINIKDVDQKEMYIQASLLALGQNRKDVHFREENNTQLELKDAFQKYENVRNVRDGENSVNAAFDLCSLSPMWFNGVMSRERLDQYLSKSISMAWLSELETYGGPTETQITDDIRMILNVGAKYVGRMVGLWSTYNQGHFNSMLLRCKSNADILHSKDCDIICEAGIFEWIEPSVNGFTIPSYVRTAFDIPSTAHLTKFSYENMLYNGSLDGSYIRDPDLRDINNITNTPDITKLQTQMWFFYLATQYIKNGCEAIHFGQVELMNRKDTGNRFYWGLLQKIRAYARINARRHLVLCNAHTGACALGENNGSLIQGGVYFDPIPYSPATTPAWERQLMFDFHAAPIIFSKNSWKPCTEAYQPIRLVTDKGNPTNQLRKKCGLVNQSLGGKNPLGWYCQHNPYILEFDNYSGMELEVRGCGTTKSWDWDVWGWDDICYFATQTESWRNKILIYLVFKLSCLDKNGFIEMPGRRGLSIPFIPPYTNPGHVPAAGWPTYRANTGAYNQEDTIKKVWSGYFNGVSAWLHHDFTGQDVWNSGGIGNVASSLVFVGNDKIFYIATDGYIHGYVFYNGIWLTVSPTYAAQGYHGQSASLQVKAQSDLVASPDRTRLLYIGIDGYIHGFKVNNLWDYEWFSFMTTEMRSQKIKAVGSLIYPDVDRIYYIATYYPDGVHSAPNDSNRVHGFQKGSGIWRTVSPTYSAASVYGQSLPVQNKASGALTYINSYPLARIYYRDTLGMLCYYEVHNLTDYSWVACPGNRHLNDQGLTIVGNIAVYANRFYFVGRERSGARRVHCLIDDGMHWDTVSPSHSAALYSGQPLSTQKESEISGEISISPDGKLIAFWGRLFPFVCYYENIDNVNYSFHTMGSSGWMAGKNSIQFTENRRIEYVSEDSKVRQFTFAEDCCSNDIIRTVER